MKINILQIDKKCVIFRWIDGKQYLMHTITSISIKTTCKPLFLIKETNMFNVVSFVIDAIDIIFSKQQYIYSATLVKCIKEEFAQAKFKSWMSPLKATVLERIVWHSQSTKTAFLETWMVYLKVTVIS